MNTGVGLAVGAGELAVPPALKITKRHCSNIERGSRWRMVRPCRDGPCSGYRLKLSVPCELGWCSNPSCILALMSCSTTVVGLSLAATGSAVTARSLMGGPSRATISGRG